MAARAAIDLANQSGAELHGVYVGEARFHPAPEHYEMLARQPLDGPVEGVITPAETSRRATLR